MNYLRILLVLVIAFFLFGCATKPEPVENEIDNITEPIIEEPVEEEIEEIEEPVVEEPESSEPYSNYALPISERSFYLGLLPSPKSDPTTTYEDTIAAYEETAQLAEVSMVWTVPSGIGQYERLKQSQAITGVRVYGLIPVVTLTFWTIEEIEDKGLVVGVDAPEGIEANLSDEEFRTLWVQEAKKIAEEYQPEYFSLGNEVNDFFYFYPGAFDDYLSLCEDAYSEIKEVSPNTKVMVVFSYNHMIENEQQEMISEFEDVVDVMGFTTYPWKYYDNPEDIPDDYYADIERYTNKPVAFTEIGWASAHEANSSEEEQAEYLVKFLNLTKDMDVEMVNWLFLHYMQLTDPKFTSETGTISLNNADGTKKVVYDVWRDLKDLPLSR